jgi:hypothetical protein
MARRFIGRWPAVGRRERGLLVDSAQSCVDLKVVYHANLLVRVAFLVGGKMEELQFRELWCRSWGAPSC